MLLHLDNFESLDEVRTSPPMNDYWLKKKYLTVGPVADSFFVGSVSSSTCLESYRRAANSVNALICYPVGRDCTVGVRVIQGRDVNTCSLSLISPVANGYRVIFGFQLNNTTINYMSDSNSQSVPYNDSGYIDYVLSEANDSYKLTLYVDNVPVLQDMLDLPDTLYTAFGQIQEYSGSGEWTISDSTTIANGPNPYVCFADLYVANGGLRYGKPTVTTASINSVTSSLNSDTSDSPSTILSGIPDLDSHMSGSGLTSVDFAVLPSDNSQIEVLSQSNSPNSINTEIEVEADITTNSVTSVEYTKLITDSDELVKVTV